jgi:hypothetical protein
VAVAARARAGGRRLRSAGPLALVVFLPLLGAFVLALTRARSARRVLARSASLWTVPGALFLLAAAWFGASGHSVAGVRWLERCRAAAASCSRVEPRARAAGRD